MNALAIATYAANQILDHDVPILVSMDVHFATGGFIGEALAVELHNMERTGSKVSRTAQILAEMRQANHDANQAFSETVDEVVATRGARMRRNGVIRAAGPSYPLATSKGRREALMTGDTLVAATRTMQSNQERRDASLPRRAMSMCASRGRVRPDMVESLLAYFASPGSLAEHLLASFLPARPNYNTLVDYLGTLGIEATKADVAGLLKGLGAGRTQGRGGRPRKVRTYRYCDCETPHVPQRIGHSRIYKSDAMPMGRIPGSAEGKGHDQGSGWAKAWAEGKALTPAQVQRRDVALDAFNAACKRQEQEASK